MRATHQSWRVHRRRTCWPLRTTRYGSTVDDWTDAELVAAIRNDDQQAWRVLVDRHSGLVWRVARSVVSDDHAATDAMQTAWLRLLEHVDRLDDPRAVSGWLVTTARREAMALSRKTARQQPTEPAGWQLDAPTLEEDDPGEVSASNNQAATVLRELRKLGAKCQQLLTLLAHKVRYEEIAEQMDIAVGGIGPTRSRCLDQLRSAPAIVAFGGQLA